jgi:hypothetical protein
MICRSTGRRKCCAAWYRSAPSDPVRLDGAVRAVAGAFISTAETARAEIEGGGHQRHSGEGAGPQAAASAQRAHLAYVGDRDHPAVSYDYTGDARTCGSGIVFEILSRLFVSGCVCGLRQLLLQPERRMVEVGCGPCPAARASSPGNRSVAYADDPAYDRGAVTA